ncbi:protein NLRC5 [Ctenodactylus gundi]
MDNTSLELGTENLWGCLVRFLSANPEWLSAKVKFFLPNLDLASSNKALDPEQRVILQLSKMHSQGRTTWQSFIHCVCMELEVPLGLEVPLMSTWGQEDGKGSCVFPISLPLLFPGLKRPHQSCESSPHRKNCRTQQPELAQRYLQLLRIFAQQHYVNGFPGPGQSLSSLQAYVPSILQWNRATVPLHAREEETMGDLKTEDGTDVSIQDLFNLKAPKGSKVTVLLGKSGMGKTTLARWLCHKWADGQLDHFQALFFFEFRRLNLITHFLTLPQLLFDLYLSPESDPDTIFQYLKENADRVLLIFDGLDEALHPCSIKETVGSDGSGPAFTLFSGLCCGTLLPGCWVIATSRPGKLPPCLPTEATMIHMWGFDQLRMEEYMNYFFTQQQSQEVALAELRANRHLRSMCAVPALCQVVCVCLYHLLPASLPGQSAALLPTVTQLYMQMVLTLSPLPPTSLLGLGEVALSGLETGKIIFHERDIPPPVMAFGAAHNLLTSFCVHTSLQHQETGYAFTHLSLQEFLAALYLMASPKVDKNTLTHHVTLNSRWVLRTRARLGLADYLSTFLAGLASHTCCAFLSHLAQRNEAWVGARQATVVQLLRKLATRKLTGPKLVDVCHCVAETQEPQLASLAAQSLPFQITFHNFPLTYADLAALTYILKHRTTPIHLDFEGCPLEPQCPRALVGCRQVETLSFKSRKCGDAFAKALAGSLPTMEGLKKLGFTGSKITAGGISHLVQALPLCLQLEEVSLQDNQLKDREVMELIEVLPSLPQLQKLDLSRNNFSVSTLLWLVKVAVTCPTIKTLQVREAGLIFLLSPPTETTADRQRAADLQEEDSQVKETQSRTLTLRLQKCQLSVHDAEVLVDLLLKGPRLEEVDLSGNQLEDEGCRLLAEATPQLCISRKLDLSDNDLSKAGVAYVLRAASTCQSLAELHVSLLHRIVVLSFAHDEEEQEGARERLTQCGLQAKDLQKVCEALEGSCHRPRPSHLDLSGNTLGDKGAALLAQLLPGLGPLQSLNLSENGLSLDAVFSLTQCLSSLQWVCHLDVNFESQHILLRGDKSDSLKKCQLEPTSLARLCTTLEECPGPLQVQLSCEVLSDQSLETLLLCLPRLPQLSLLQLSHTALSPRSPFLLANIFSWCPRAQKVDLRSLCHATLYFGSSEDPEGVCCGLTDCSLCQEHVEPLCEMLSKCANLRQLDLTANLLGDAGLRCLLEHLPQVPISGSLDLSHNNISQEGVLHLVETLPSCPRVLEASVNLGCTQDFRIHFSEQEEARMTLRLNECSFGPEHVSRLAASITQALQLIELTLTQCCLGLEQLTVLLSLVRRPSGLLSLRVEEPWVGRARVPALLEVCAQASGNVTEVSISKSQQLFSVQLEFPHQEENPEAMALRLAHCDLGSDHSLLVRQLMDTCARLQRLSLSQVNLCDTGNASSLLLQNLLLSLSELKTFRLSSSCVSPEGLAHLMSGLGHCHHLEELEFSHNQSSEEGTEALMGALEGKCQMRKLHLSHLPLSGSKLAMLTRGLSHMRLLRSSRNITGDISHCQISEPFKAATSLEELALSHSQIGDAGAQHFAVILSGLPELRKIDLSANSIGPTGGVQLAKSLTFCKHLEELILGCNTLEDPTALALAQRLPQHLKVLRLPSSRLGPEGALSLGQALDGSPHVEEISLAENNLAKGVPHFCKGLPTLRRIDLVSCEIDNQTAKHLAASFVLCPALEEILLSWNLLGDEAAAELAQVLPQMGRLKRLDLEKNRITATGAWLLAKGLTQESGIQVIRLWSNPVPPAEARYLQSQEPRLDFTFFDNQPQTSRGT